VYAASKDFYEEHKDWALYNSNHQVLGFVNLTNNDNDLWNKGKNGPVEQRNLQVSILLYGSVKSVFIASPDRDMGRPYNLQYMIDAAEKGQTLKLSIPFLHVWDLLVIELEL
jgi:dextranase